MYASEHTQLQQDSSVPSLCHPLLLHTFKPVHTTGDGSCLFHALSLTLTGTETCTDLLRLLTVYAVAKYKATLMSAFHDAFPEATERDYQIKFNSAVIEAVNVNVWGTDYHLFVLCLLMDRPIFHYNTDNNCPLPTTDSVEQFAQRFLSFEIGTRIHTVYCNSVHRVMLTRGDINGLSLPPISIFNVAFGGRGYHWVAMLPKTQAAMQHIPIPKTRILAD